MSWKPSINWLLIFVPISIGLHFFGHSETLLFISACLAVIPLAGWMGHATEELSTHLGEGAGGLLNATFGNAAELIIALLALQKGLIDVVKASIIGSIIGNLLLVLGVSIVSGGFRFPRQRFNQTAARSASTSLMLAAVGLLIPTIFHFAAAQSWSPRLEEKLSLAIAVVLFATYACTLLFSLRTHKQLFSGPVGKAAAPAHAGWSKGKAMTVLLIATVLVAIMSEFLVRSVEAARIRFGFSEVFVGIIVVAIIGNAAEHSTAVAMALKNKMDLSLGIAIGSSLQIALFVAPVLVFVSFLLGHPMSLEFSIPEVAAVVISVHLVEQITGDGESNWLEGVQLLAVYLILGLLFYFLPSH